METIGKRLQILLEDRDMKQRDLAKAIDVTEVTISRYIHNLREPKGEIIARIASALGVTADYLLGRVENQSSQPGIVKESNAQYSLDLSDLPEEAVQQVKDYVEYVKQKYQLDKKKK